MRTILRSGRTSTTVAAVLAASLLTLTACDSGDSGAASDSAVDTTTVDDNAPAGDSDAGQPASTSPADLIVDDSLTPEGYEYTPPTGEDELSLAELVAGLSDDPEIADAEGLVGGNALDSMTQADPTQCTGLAVDSLTVMDWMFRPAATTATAGYTPVDNDEDGLFVMVTTNEADPQSFPAEVSQCAEFTRAMSDDTDNTLQRYTAEPVDLTVEGADVLGAARVTMTGVEINGEPVDGEGIGSTMNTLTATVNGVTFTIAASEATPLDLLSSVASAQAQRITNA